MAKITLYEKAIEANAKKFSRQFPKHIREYAKKTIEHLLERGRELALIDGHLEAGLNFYYLDPAMYRAGFERNTETIQMYCEQVSKSEKPLKALQILEEPDYFPLIRLFTFREAIKARLPLNADEIKNQLTLIKEKGRRNIEAASEKAEIIEQQQSKRNYDSSFYKKNPFDSRPDYHRDVECENSSF